MKHITLTLAVMAAVSFSSCSVVKNKTNTPAPKSTTSTVQTVNTPQPGQPSALAKELLGEWQIIQAGDYKIAVDEDQPYANFSADGRLYASNGCNVINGDYKVNGKMVSFSQVLTTMRACPDTPYETAINRVLCDGVTMHAQVTEMGNESYLYFNDSRGKALMTLVRHNMHYLDGQWMVTAINGHAVSDDEANVFIDLASRKIHGNTGCNFFNGSIIIDPGVANSINFNGMGVTRMACPKGDQERNMLVALEETVKALPIDKNTVGLINENGQQVLTLTRVTITK